ncbi:hypothetical protein MSKOL_3412 [Methanosarcina sp. Kolksee]|nr:hypothetical protein MSKOL_3412 [Methanosarcina sp. Kolksee]
MKLFILGRRVGRKLSKAGQNLEKLEKQFSYRTAMKTIDEAFREFLKEQKRELSPRTHRDYENLISLFEEYLDVCASDDLYEEDQALYEEKHKNEHKEYCQIFDLEYIVPLDIEYFLEDYLINDFGGSAAFVETSRRFFRKFLPWAYEKDYLDPEHYSELAEVVGNIRKKGKKTASQVQKFGSLLCDYVDAHPAEESPEWKEGDFEIRRVEPGKLWVEDYLDPYIEIGPVKVSEEVSSLAKTGWYLNFGIVKVRDFWQIVYVEGVSSRCPY